MLSRTYGYVLFPFKEPSEEEKEEKKKQLMDDRNGDWKVKDENDIVYEYHSGTTFDRQKWKALKAKLTPIDKLVVVSLESFSRATFRTTLKEIDDLKKRGIYLVILEFELKKKRKELWDYVADIYEYFEEIRLERQGTAIASIAANMVLRSEKYPGRRTVVDTEFLEQIQDLLRQNVTSPTELAKRLDKSRSTIYKALKLLKEQDKFPSEIIADGET